MKKGVRNSSQLLRKLCKGCTKPTLVVKSVFPLLLTLLVLWRWMQDEQMLMVGVESLTTTNPSLAARVHDFLQQQDLLTDQDIWTKYFDTNSEAMTKLDMLSVSPKFAITDFKGRLGNRMFEYASLYGIARHNNLIAVVPASLELLRHFHIDAQMYRHTIRRNFRHYFESKACTFEPSVMNFGDSRNIRLHGYFQSWKYFQSVEKDIRRQFKWKDHIQRNAEVQFESLTGGDPTSTYVGVHVRRGDMVHNEMFVTYGYVVADKEYLLRAMNYFRSKMNKVAFIITSDDVEWCISNINANDSKIVTTANRPEVDMAILSMCNHTIVTAGSFGWWSAWMAGGEVVYNKGYPRPKSRLYDELNPADYRPPSWIGM